MARLRDVRAGVAGSMPSPLVSRLRSMASRSVALTKLDVLDALDEIKVCVGYKLDGREL